MPTLTITGHDMTKKGNAVAIAGNDRYMVGKKTTLPPIGARIKADTSESSFQGAKGTVTLWWLNDWSLDEAQPAPAQVAAMQKEAVTQAGGRERFQYDEAVLRFVSNVVGSALTALRCNEPAEIAKWAEAAHRAAAAVLQGLPKGSRDKPFDDEF